MPICALCALASEALDPSPLYRHSSSPPWRRSQSSCSPWRFAASRHKMLIKASSAVRVCRTFTASGSPCRPYPPIPPQTDPRCCSWASCASCRHRTARTDKVTDENETQKRVTITFIHYIINMTPQHHRKYAIIVMQSKLASLITASCS